MNSEIISVQQLPVVVNLRRPRSSYSIPLYLYVILGFVGGAALGAIFGRGTILPGITVAELGELGMLVMRALKTLAVPLVFFAILNAILKSPISAGQGKKLFLFCGMNLAVAFVIGLTIMNTLKPGEFWRERMSGFAAAHQSSHSAPAVQATLHPLKNLDGYIPQSIIEPFSKNNIISVILLALLVAFSLRNVRERSSDSTAAGARVLERCIAAIYEMLVQMLSWLVRAVPFAVFCLVAQAVGRSGLGVFSSLWIFVVVILCGLAIHGFVYYPLIAWFAAGKSPRSFFSEGADAIIMGVTTNSSLATVPVTLRCLTENMCVSEQSARLSACIGTNLNNDGVTLYEAMAALFLAQACGLDLNLSTQLAILAAAVMAGVGVAGIPEAGLIVLPLVLGAAGLPDWLIAAAIPLIMPVDWIIARVRSAVNVMSDILVALLLDRGATRLNNG